MEYSFHLKEFLEGKQIPIPKTSVSTRYQYGKAEHSSLLEVLELIYGEVFQNVEPAKVRAFIKENNESRNRTKIIPVILEAEQMEFHLGNNGTVGLLNGLKSDMVSLGMPLQYIQSDKIIFKNLPDDSNVEVAKYKNGRENKQMNVNDLVKNSIEANKQVIFTGAPGTGKTYSVRKYVKEVCEDENQYRFVQFHPSYDYSDFVEGLRPVVIKGQTEATFVRMDGVFKAFCRHIVEENANCKTYVNNKKYFFIVDEINRADLAKVFGELMFGLEESYRGEENSFDTQYKNLVTYRILDKKDIQEGNCREDEIGKAVPMTVDVFKDGFYIPENLYFIGTMNDIDRSVDSMDFALRRRFQWVDIKANEIMNASLHSMFGEASIHIDELAESVKSMNLLISTGNKFGLSEAYHIGPAYFKNLNLSDYKNSLEWIFEHNVASTLREYTRGRKAEEVNAWIRSCKNELLGE